MSEEYVKQLILWTHLTDRPRRMSFSGIGRLPLIALLACLLYATPFAFGADTMGYHQVKLDSTGRIVPGMASRQESVRPRCPSGLGILARHALVL